MGIDDLDPTLSEAGATSCPEALSPLGRSLKEIRRRFIEEGGKLLTPEEVDSISERRGAASPIEDEDYGVCRCRRIDTGATFDLLFGQEELDW